MPKRNKLPSIPDYRGIGKNSEKLTVQKSNPLQSLSQTAMTLPELKILDAYLARIDSHNPDKRCVQFEKGELEKLLNYTRMHRDELEKRIDNLFQIITIQDEEKPNGFTKISLFVKAECFQDKDGLWKVNLVCSEEAMEYIFNVENLGYLKYRLRNIVNFTSRRSYFLYLYLEDNIWRKTWKIDLSDLKQILDCTAVTYLEFKEFNKQILKKGQKDILKNTDILFTYSTIKSGRRVVAIKFEVERVKRIEEIFADKKPEPSWKQSPKEQPPSVPFYDDSEIPQIPDYDQAFSSSQSEPLKTPLYSGFHSFETDFTPEQIQCLSLILETKLGFSTPERIDQLLRGLYAKCKEACPDARKPFAYLLKAVENLPVEESAKPKQKDEDNDCNADEYKFFVNNWDLIEAEKRQRNEARKDEVTEVDVEETAEERKKRENDEWWAEHMALIKR